MPKNLFQKKADPTPEEIEAECREIQSGWDDVERRLRLPDSEKPEAWTPPVVRRHVGEPE